MENEDRRKEKTGKDEGEYNPLRKQSKRRHSNPQEEETVVKVSLVPEEAEATVEGTPAPLQEAEVKPSVPERQKTAGKSRRPVPKKGEPGESGFVEQVVSINRVTKVTKGGKRLAFSALVVVGDTKGRVGYGLCKAGEVSIAIRKSLAYARRNVIQVVLKGSTIAHQIEGVCGGSVVMLKPAAEGTGVIAAGPVRAVCDSVGIRNILSKCHRSNNPINVVKATIDGLSRLKSVSPVEGERDLAIKKADENVPA